MQSVHDQKSVMAHQASRQRRARCLAGAGGLEGNYHNPPARAAERAVQSGAQRIDVLGDLVERVFVPGRFKHIYGDEGVPYLDSAQILKSHPTLISGYSP